MKKIIIVGLCVNLGLALMVTAVLAWGPGFGRGHGMGPRYGYPAIPNLTPEQSTQIQALRDAFLKEIEPLQKDLVKKEQESRNLWPTPNADPAVIKAKQNEIFDLQSKLQEKTTNFRLEIRKVLTPEQLAQLPAFGPGVGFWQGMGFGPPMGTRGTMGCW